jgi:hypothetical protein
MKKTIFVFLLGFLLIFIVACEIDHGIEPIRSSIQGEIQYKGTWPGTPAEVRLIAANKFPPAGVSDLILGETVPTNVQSYQFSFYLKPGTYNVLGVAWREQESTWDILSICGLYFSGTDSLLPGDITLAYDTSNVKGIKIVVNCSKARRVVNARITGKINFQGTWPDSISEVRVVASSAPTPNVFALLQKPPTLLDLSFSDAITPNSAAVNYSINAAPMKYYVTGVIFFRMNRSLSMADLTYSLKVGGLKLQQIQPVPEDAIAGPDFNIVF